MLTKKIVVTGGSGRFGKTLKKYSNIHYLFPNKKELNILNLKSIKNYLKKKKTKIFNSLSRFVSSYVFARKISN